MLGDSLRRRRRGGDRTTGAGSVDVREAARIAGVGLAAVAVSFAVGYLVATQLLFPREADEADGLVGVPELFQQRVPSVRRTLEERGLALGRVDTLRHPTVAAGAVLAQDPLPGQLWGPGDSVRVTVSGGPERRTVPDVRMLRGDDAGTILRSSGFTVRVDSVFDEEAPGRVVALEPEVGDTLALPAEVRVVVSRGPATVEMPLLLTLDFREARTRLEALGLVVSSLETEDVDVLDSGTVIGQSPAAGAEVERGAAVRLTAVAGPGVRLGTDTLPEADSIPSDTLDGEPPEEGPGPPGGSRNFPGAAPVEARAPTPRNGPDR